MATGWSDLEILPREFYARPTVEVARDLLGMVLVHGRTAGRIVEVEAYLGLEDGAAHASRGVTPRTRVLFGEPGHAYVFFIYGMYECLNLVAEREGTPGCVLIRALEPLSGIGIMRRRRGLQRIEELASGPGKLTIAMGISRIHNGADVTRGKLTVRRPPQREPVRITASARIGIRKAADRPLRFCVEGRPGTCGVGFQPASPLSAGLVAAWKGGCDQDWPPHQSWSTAQAR
ncbi:MAG: DNA-3-methyladenine glycosylase [Acidobacteria bacterium]|nr:DNA-3-methyladenine glycosylase [Acidobacteriota bacterium]